MYKNKEQLRIEYLIKQQKIGTNINRKNKNIIKDPFYILAWIFGLNYNKFSHLETYYYVHFRNKTKA